MSELTLEKYEKNWCPWHKKYIKPRNVHHLKNLCTELNKSKDEVRFERIQKYFPELCLKDNLINLYVNKLYSLPDFKNEFGIKYHDLLHLLSWFNIPKRSSSESAKKITVKKQERVLKKLGVKNYSQLDTVKRKKRETFLKNCGKDNIFKTKQFQLDLDDYFLKRYGKSKSQYLSVKGKEVWENLTDNEKQKWLDKSLFSEDARENWRYKGCYTSKTELRVQDILNTMGISYETNFPIRKIENRKRGYYYDLYLKKYNLIIEVNGTYWHADPRYYLPDDIINYKKGIRRAKDKWEEDKKKIDTAKKRGYGILILWEADINGCREDIINIIKHEIDNIEEYKED